MIPKYWETTLFTFLLFFASTEEMKYGCHKHPALYFHQYILKKNKTNFRKKKMSFIFSYPITILYFSMFMT